MGAEPKIVVYSITGCPHCVAAKNSLQVKSLIKFVFSKYFPGFSSIQVFKYSRFLDTNYLDLEYDILFWGFGSINMFAFSRRMD